jgi:tricorn protease
VKWAPHIFTIPIEGGEVTEILTGITWSYQPCWSPDGKAIAFLGREEVQKNTWINNIYTMPAEGGQPRRITSPVDKVTLARIA